MKDISLTTEDKLTVNGELILQAAAGEKAWNSRLSKIHGKGVIYANADTLQAVRGVIANSDVESKNLGATSKHFKGIALENTDNSAAHAVEWEEVDGEFGGWLGINTEDFRELAFQDQVDYIKFTADRDGTVRINGSDWGNGTSDTVQIAGMEGLAIAEGSCLFEVAAGKEYIIGITRNDADSMSYTIAFEA